MARDSLLTIGEENYRKARKEVKNECYGSGLESGTSVWIHILYKLNTQMNIQITDNVCIHGLIFIHILPSSVP